MGQENNAKIATLPLQEFTAVDAESLVNTYADDLVSGLFEDVDKILDGDEAALAEVEQAESSITVPSVIEAQASEAAADDSDSMALVPTEKTEEDASDQLTPTTEQPTPQPEPAPKTPMGKLLDRFLLTTTVFSLLGILGFVVYSYQRGASWLSPKPVADSEAGLSQSDAEFLEYLNRSLDVIAKKAERNANADADVAQVPNVSVLPASPPLLPPLTPAPTAGGLMSPAPGPVNVIERVYIPYQTAQQPAVTSGTPQVAQVPQALTPPVQPQPGAPATVHVLVGLLELGDRSAALFEIDGVPQRVYMGEPIGASGWNLVSVSNDEARIRRNGEVRSIYIGQQF